jgi:tetratricopeptide (TPR) repeat protein
MLNRLLLCGFTLLALAVTAAAQETAQAYLDRGREQLEHKQYLQAKESFEAAVRLGPNLAEAYYYRGQVQMDRDEGEKDFTKAIELKPDFADAYYQRGLNRDLNNNAAGAMKDYNRALELNPRLINAYMTRAVLYMLDNKYPLAIADYTKVIELQPDGTGYYVRGTAYLDSHRYAEAVKDLTRSIELDPTYYWSYMQRAKAYRALRRYRLAQADEAKAAAIGPPSGD